MRRFRLSAFDFPEISKLLRRKAISLATKKYPKATEPNTVNRMPTMMNLNVTLARNRNKESNGLIDAVRLLCHIVSEAFIGPGPTASADPSELAPPTFSLIAIRISKILENFGGVPDLLESFFFYISAIDFKIATGLNLTDMGDEAERDTSQTSSSHRVQSLPPVERIFPLFFCLLSEDAVIVRGTGGLELKGDLISLLIKPEKGFFIIEGRYLLTD
jgi:hypothetical protein